MRTANIFLKSMSSSMDIARNLTHGRYDARPTVTVPATEHHHGPLAGTPQPSSLMTFDLLFADPGIVCSRTVS